MLPSLASSLLDRLSSREVDYTNFYSELLPLVVHNNNLSFGGTWNILWGMVIRNEMLCYMMSDRQGKSMTVSEFWRQASLALTCTLSNTVLTRLLCHSLVIACQWCGSRGRWRHGDPSRFTRYLKWKPYLWPTVPKRSKPMKELNVKLPNYKRYEACLWHTYSYVSCLCTIQRPASQCHSFGLRDASRKRPQIHICTSGLFWRESFSRKYAPWPCIFDAIHAYILSSW